MANLALGIILFIFIIGRQVKERVLKRSTFIILPIVALYEAISMYHPLTSTWMWQEGIVLLIIGVIGGVTQGMITKVYERDGIYYSKGGYVYAACWIILIVLRILVKFMFNQGISTETLWLTWLSVIVIYGVRGLVMYLRFPNAIRYVFSENGKMKQRAMIK